MQTATHPNPVKTTCILLIVLASASLLQAYPPDNAAVLYYKAFLMMQEPGADVKTMMSDLRKGKIEPNDEIRKYIEGNKYVIEFAEAAGDIGDCDWGHDTSRGLGVLMPELLKTRQTAFLLVAKAQILAEEGEYRTALSKCLTVRKMARHVSSDLLIAYLVGTSLNNLANERIEDILSRMPQDLETLLWLKSQTVALSVNTASIKVAMAGEKAIAMQEIREERIDSLLEEMGGDLLKDEIGAEAVAKVRNGDARFFQASRDYYANLMDDVIAAVDLPYPESHRKLTALNDRVQKDAKSNPAAITAALLVTANSRVRTLGTKSGTFTNAIRAAIDIYLVKARTGKLPETLPADLPKDLFSGKGFAYEKTTDGFTLRCQGRDLDKNELHQYEFRVSK